MLKARPARAFSTKYIQFRIATNSVLDNKLIMQALTLGHHKSKYEAFTSALKEYIAHKKQLNILNVFGSVDFDTEYNYKKARKR